MLLGAKNGTLKVGHTLVDYITFGRGPHTLVIIPGLGDGLRTVRGMATPFALAYRQYARQHQVYVFSRPRPLASGCSTRQMAAQLRAVMERLGIAKARVVGISQGGMIAQYLAIDCPQAVEKLVLAVTAGRCNAILQEVVGQWLRLAGANDYKGILVDTAERSYSEKHLKRYRPLYPLLGRLGRPKSLGRFILQAKACLGHNACAELGKVACPVLVVGGGCDRIVGGDSARELAAQLPGSRLVLYPALGHGLYEETPDFHRQVLSFLAGAAAE